MRLTFTEEEYIELRDFLIDNVHSMEQYKLVDMLLEKRLNYENSITSLKRNATEKAIKANKEKAKEKIQNAINILRIQNKPITQYAVSKESGCSINTVKKYREFIEANNFVEKIE